jgi:hypothetical protein
VEDEVLPLALLDEAGDLPVDDLDVVLVQVLAADHANDEAVAVPGNLQGRPGRVNRHRRLSVEGTIRPGKCWLRPVDVRRMVGANEARSTVVE